MLNGGAEAKLVEGHFPVLFSGPRLVDCVGFAHTVAVVAVMYVDPVPQRANPG